MKDAPMARSDLRLRHSNLPPPGERPPFLRSKAHFLRRFADAAPPLLGAPLLAVIATFFMQPRASGFEHGASHPTPPQHQSAADTNEADHSTLSYAASEVLRAIEARDPGRARALLPLLPDDAREHREAFGVMLECVEAPSNDVTARAYRYYLEQAPKELRQPLYAACLAAPR